MRISRWNRSGPSDGGQLGMEHLERHRPVVAEVVRQVDRRHAAAAQFPIEPVPVAEGGLESGAEVGHGWPYFPTGVNETSARHRRFVHEPALGHGHDGDAVAIGQVGQRPRGERDGRGLRVELEVPSLKLSSACLVWKNTISL